MPKKIGSTIEARLSRTGGIYYIRVPKQTVEFHGLKVGDVLRVKIEEAVEGE